jgi:hypothetical protein
VCFVQRRKQRRLRTVDSGHCQIGVEELFRLMVHPDEIFLTAFVDQAQAGALAF